jgi:hypothetical protein
MIGRPEEFEASFLAPAAEYIAGRTWQKCGDVLAEALDKAVAKVKAEKEEAARRAAIDAKAGLAPAEPVYQPPTVPRIIPIQEPNNVEKKIEGPQAD